MLLESLFQGICKQLVLRAQLHRCLLLLAVGQVAQLLAALEQVVDACYEQLGIEWFGEIGIGSVLVALDLLRLGAARREQYHGYVAGDAVFLELLTELQSVHHGHHNVAHYDVGHALAGQFQATLAVSSFQNVELVGKQGAQIAAHIGVVVDYQHIGKLLGVVLFHLHQPPLLHAFLQRLLSEGGFCGVVVDRGLRHSRLELEHA